MDKEQMCSDLKKLIEIRDTYGVAATDQALKGLSRGVTVSESLERLKHPEEVEEEDAIDPKDCVFVDFDEKDLETLCICGKYDISDIKFESELSLSKNGKDSIKKIRKRFKKDAKVSLAYVIGIAEGWVGNDTFCHRCEKVHSAPYKSTVYVFTTKEDDDFNLVVSWPKEGDK